MASNLRRSKRTVGKQVTDLDRRIRRLQKNPAPRRLAARTVTSNNLAQNAVTSVELAPAITDSISGAQATANGKNKITYSLSAPGSTANTAGDIWWQYDASNIIIGQWTGLGGTSWQANTIGNTIIANLDAGKITAGILEGIQIRGGSPVGGLYPFDVTNLGVMRAVSGTIGAFTLSSTTLTASDLATGIGGVSSTIELATSGQIKTRLDGVTVNSSYYTEVYVNKASADGGIEVTGNASGTQSTSKILASIIQTREFRHDAYTLGTGYGKYTAASSSGHVVFGDGDTAGYTMRIVKDNDLYGQTTSSGTLDVLVNDSNTLVAPSSSIRFKENVNNLDIDYKKILAIQPVTFYYKDTGEAREGSERHLEHGVIAEQVEEAGVTQLVNYKDGVPFAVSYSKMSVFLLEVCKKQEERINELETRISKLEK